MQSRQDCIIKLKEKIYIKKQLHLQFLQSFFSFFSSTVSKKIAT